MRSYLAVSLLASAISIQVNGAACKCTDLILDVPVEVDQAKLTPIPLESDIDAVAFNAVAVTRPVAPPAGAEQPKLEIVKNNKTYTISARYCKPSGGNDNGVLLYLTHGIGYDKRYWDFPSVNGKPYSFVEHANKVGYHTFSIDRLGVGKSSIPDPYEPQFASAVAINAALSARLREGGVRGIAGGMKQVHIGHSYGSIVTAGVARHAPTAADAIILTGYSTNLSWISTAIGAFNFRLARSNQPDRFGPGGKDGERPAGYLTWADAFHGMFNFLQYPYFDKDILAVNEGAKMPLPIGEFLTIGSEPADAPAPEFKGPVLVLTGKTDTFFCGGDCDGILDSVKTSYPAASKFQSYVQPNMGHGINLHHNATGAYDVAIEFMLDNDLGSA